MSVFALLADIFSARRRELSHQRILDYLDHYGESSTIQISAHLDMGWPALFPALHRLEAAGKIEWRWSWPAPVERPRLRLYRIRFD